MTTTLEMVKVVLFSYKPVKHDDKLWTWTSTWSDWSKFIAKT